MVLDGPAFARVKIPHDELKNCLDKTIGKKKSPGVGKPGVLMQPGGMWYIRRCKFNWVEVYRE
jgi:hypothetical protein